MDKRKEEALDIFKKYPNAVPSELQAKILAQQVVIGMDPYMAHLAAGAFTFRVDADPIKWVKKCRPLQRHVDAVPIPGRQSNLDDFSNRYPVPGRGQKNVYGTFQKRDGCKDRKTCRRKTMTTTGAKKSFATRRNEAFP
ncbi:MAG: hypothetical protein ACYC9L_13685 [Sulfuricaulis sp.]